jgi:hypothetical protein
MPSLAVSAHMAQTVAELSCDRANHLCTLTQCSMQVLRMRSSCNFALAFLADIYTEQIKLLRAMSSKEAAASAAKCAQQCLRHLMTADPMRHAYWQQRLVYLDL